MKCSLCGMEVNGVDEFHYTSEECADAWRERCEGISKQYYATRTLVATARRLVSTKSPTEFERLLEELRVLVESESE